MSAVMEVASWPASHGSISEESIRRLHRPNYRHRFSVQEYPAGTEFSGAQRVSTRYVLCGACEFTFGNQSVTIEADQSAVLPAGDYWFRVVGRADVELVSVFELPFDVVHHRRDGIEYLEDHGIHAAPQDWVLGETIVAYQRPDEHRGITVWKQALCLAPEADGWLVEDLTQPWSDRPSFPNLKDACDHVIAAWLDPGWRRLGRDEAKRLLARSRMPNLAEAQKLEVLDEYLVYANATDIEEAIQAGELPALEKEAVAHLARGVRPERFLSELEPLLEDWLVHELKYALNAYIREELRALGHEVIIEGEMEHGGLCPCCEYLAIDPGEEGMWDICAVCCWENGGDGPNHMKLADAKKNFAKLGAIDERSLEHVAPDRKRKYRRGYP